MGSSSSRLGSRPPRRPSRATTTVNNRTTTTKRNFLSSLFICGASTSQAPIEREEDPAELLVSSAEHSDGLVNNIQGPTKESILTSGGETGFRSPKSETAASSECRILSSEASSFEDGLGIVETSNQGKGLCERNESTSVNHRDSDRASTSCEVGPPSDPLTANGLDNLLCKDMPQICLGVTQCSSACGQELGGSCSDGLSVENHASEVTSVHNLDSRSASVVSDSPLTFDSGTDDNFRETTPSGLGFLVSEREQDQRDGSLLHLDVVSISSNILSSSTADASNHEARRNSRRMFWDAFSRRSSRRHSDSRTFVFSTDDSDDSGPHDRWLLDFSGDFFDEGVRGDTGHLSRTHSISDRRWNSRSEIWERLRADRDGHNRRTNICPSALHPDGTCACQSILMAEDTGARASISRIVMLAEALFEVLDEIHRQPASLSLSMVSLPAPDSVVDSLPLKNHKNTPMSGDDVEQCYICLAEYKEGDKIRVLPCRHEYHMSCVDKWLKEIHGVCPLCRGDVREGFTEASVSNPEIPSV